MAEKQATKEKIDDKLCCRAERKSMGDGEKERTKNDALQMAVSRRKSEINKQTVYVFAIC